MTSNQTLLELFDEKMDVVIRAQQLKVLEVHPLGEDIKELKSRITEVER